jgi:hypothetical protein
MTVEGRWRQILLTAVVAFLTVAALAVWKGARTPTADEFVYLGIADDLASYGVFSDASFAVTKATPPLPGRFFGPAYPAFLHLVLQVDPRLRQYVSCAVSHPTAVTSECPRPPSTLLVAQSLLTAISLSAIFYICITVSGTALVGWIAVALVMLTGEPVYYTRTYLSENLAFCWFYLFLAALVSFVAERSSKALVVAGAAIAFAALARPSYLYLYYMTGLVLALVALRRPKSFDVGWRPMLLFGVAGAVILLPWAVRNWVHFGDPGLASGYGGLILAQRVAYNAMTPTEWVAAMVSGLPDFGGALARILFSPATLAPLSWNEPTSFYRIGNEQLVPRFRAEAGGNAAMTGYILKHYVLGDLLRHCLVTVPMTWRGFWVGHYLSLLAALLAYPTGRQLLKMGRLLPYIALATPIVFMNALHGFVSVNVMRYNLTNLALFAFIVAFAAVDLMERRRWLGRSAHRPNIVGT